ncbi:MAG: transcriptional repressor [Chloroflexaceae bacterium]|nr:transcriptional repressor [Chloroflexaceae bacterium]
MPIAIDPEAWVNAVQLAWQSAGYRLTRPRVRVLQVIAGYRAPFSVEQLYADLHQQYPSPGRATVYRTVEQLFHERWVTRIHSGSSDSSYTLSWPGHLHHLICTSCGKVMVFHGCSLENLIVQLAHQTHFVIEDHLLEVYGCCADCQTAVTPENASALSS